MMDFITELTRRKVVILHGTDTLAQAAQAMCKNNIGCVLVANQQTLTGLVTDRDIVCALALKEFNLETPLSEIMSRPLVTLPAETSVEEILETMSANELRRIPLVETTEHGHQKCVGIVTLDDLIAKKIVDVHDLARVVLPQTERERPVEARQKAKTRSAARKTQTLSKFNGHISELTGLNRTQSNRLTEIVLGYVLRRVHFGEAKDLISQLPERWREEFLELPAGPDRSIKAKLVIDEVCSAFSVEENGARRLIQSYWKALGDLITTGEWVQTVLQLPKDMEELLMGDRIDELDTFRHRNDVNAETISPGLT